MKKKEFKGFIPRIIITVCILFLINSVIFSQQNNQELAKKLSNPVSSLISVPFQNNYDWGIGPNDGTRYILNVQPVIPVSIGKNLNLINRVIVPIISQSNIIGSETQTGLGDILMSNFFAPSDSKIIWGIGPVFLIPTATNDYLGGKKFGIGPTAVVLTQSNGWTIGGLTNQVWSVAGDKDRSDISTFFIQPFISFTTKSSTTIGLVSENTYNWKSKGWANANIIIRSAQVVSIGKLPVSFGLAGKYNFETSSYNSYWGVRFVVTLVFPI